MTVPEGFKPYPAASNAAPRGMILWWNGESRFGGEFKTVWGPAAPEEKREDKDNDHCI